MVSIILRVLKGKLLLPFADDLDAARIHVQEPFTIILLCGGPYTDLNDPTPRSFRDAFLKAIDNPPLSNHDLIQAEDITRQFDFFDSYEDILVFETDLAQIVDLIILFCESEGSLAELGAFAVINEIMNRLFVVVREKHWQEQSFVKLGPLRRIEHKLGRHAIQVIADADVGITNQSVARALADLNESEGIPESGLT